jgi:hypothetical protein
MLPAIRKQAQIAFRSVLAEAREELIQEVIANCFVAYQRLVKRKRAARAFPSALARFAISQVRAGRRVGNRLRISDVLSKHAQLNKGFLVESLCQFDPETAAWREMLVEDKRGNPADVAAARIDFAEWLRTLSRQQRRVAKVLATGETTSGAARKFCLTEGRISQLRHELRDTWETFQHESYDIIAATRVRCRPARVDGR